MKLAEPKKLSGSSKVEVSAFEDGEVEKICKASSIDSLKALFPKIGKVNDDLLKVSFNVAVANMINENGQGMLGSDGKKCIKNFLHKPYNIEHESSMVVGHCTNYGFSTFGDNQLIESLGSEYTENLMPFNMALGGVVYKRADKYYADLLKESDDDSSYWYHSISASWEVLYDEYVIALGSKKLADAEIIYDDARVEELTPFLLDEGGLGYLNDGTPVHRVVVGAGIIPAGVGFTFTPAAKVKGLNVAEVVEKAKKKDRKRVYSFDDVASIKAFLEENDKKIENKDSQPSKTPVLKRSMKIKEVADITEDSLKEATASDIREFIKEQIRVKNDEYVQLETQKAEEIKAKETAATQKEQELTEALSKIEDLTSQVSDLDSKLVEAVASKETVEREVAFNEHMASLDEEFEISDKQRAVIAKQIKDLGADEFENWKESFATFLSPKTAEVPEKEEEGSTGESLASKTSPEEAPNASEVEEGEADYEKYKKSFANVKISV